MKFLDYDELKQLKIGDIFAEEEYDWQEIFVVVSPPVEVKTKSGMFQLSWVGQTRNSDGVVTFLVSKDLEHYGPNIRRYDDLI